MDHGIPNERFEESIHKWSLTFRNAAEEQLYQQEMLTNSPTPYMMKVVAAMVIVMSIVFRLYAVFTAAMGLSTKTAGFGLELAFALIVVGVALVE